ncbi:MAG TPA: hypothetical protein VF637_08665 [Sphingomicrobium sp.]|jgi:hypothetical protein
MTRTPEPAPQDNAEIVERLWEFFRAVDDMTCVWAGTNRPSSFAPSDSDDCDDDEDHDRWDRFVAARAAIPALATPIQGEI